MHLSILGETCLYCQFFINKIKNLEFFRVIQLWKSLLRSGASRPAKAGGAGALAPVNGYRTNLYSKLLQPSGELGFGLA